MSNDELKLMTVDEARARVQNEREVDIANGLETLAEYYAYRLKEALTHGNKTFTLDTREEIGCTDHETALRIRTCFVSQLPPGLEVVRSELVNHESAGKHSYSIRIVLRIAEAGEEDLQS